MLVPEFFTNFSNGSLSENKFYCDQKKVSEGLEAFTEEYYNSAIKSDTQDRILKLFHQHDEYFYGYNQSSKKEDNMMYDLNFDYDGVDSDSVEKEFRDFMDTFSTEMGKLKRQIENCQTLVEKYNNGEYSGEEVEKILGEINSYYLDVPIPIESEGEVSSSGGSYKASGSYGTLPKAITRSEQVEATTEAPQVENVKEPELKDQQVMQSSTTNSNSNNNTVENKEATSSNIDSEKKKEGQLVSSVSSKNVKNDFTAANSKSQGSSKKNNSANSVLDLISNGKNSSSEETLEDKIETEVKKATGKLTSSVANLKNFNSRTVIPKMIDKTKEGGGSFIPPIAGLSAAAVAGLGTKLYIDKDDKEDDKEEKENEEEKTKFFEDIPQEDDLKISSKEDILNYLDR